MNRKGSITGRPWSLQTDALETVISMQPSSMSEKPSPSILPDQRHLIFWGHSWKFEGIVLKPKRITGPPFHSTPPTNLLSKISSGRLTSDGGWQGVYFSKRRKRKRRRKRR